MRKKIYKKKVLKKWVRVTIFVILCMIILFSFYLIYYGFKLDKNENDYLFKYDITNKADYKIYIKENLIDEIEYIGMNQPCIASDIDYIDVRYNYNFNSSQDSEVSYRYDIIGTLIIEYEDSKYGKQILYSKDYTLVNQKEGNFKLTSSFSLSDFVKINYQEYISIVNKYKIEKNINVDARLDLKMNIKTIGQFENENYEYDDVINLKIPLSEKVIMITPDYKETDEIIINTINENQIDIIPISIGMITLATTLILLIYLSKSVIFINTKSEYRKQIDRIFKEYSEILVEVSSSIEYEDFTFIDIKEFDDMIDLEEEFKSPILYYEKVKDYESWFVIIKDNFMYRYILK